MMATSRRSPSPSRLARLTEIELQNFKSIKSARVSIRPLTIVAGANSAGKSSLLQSILALTQVCRRRIEGNQFPLNDELTKLGTFSALKHQKATPIEPLRISLRFRSQLRHVLRYGRLGMGASSDSPRNRAQEVDNPVDVNWAIALDSPAELQIGSAEISAIQIKLDEPDLECHIYRDGNDAPQYNWTQHSEFAETRYRGAYWRHTKRIPGSYIGTPVTEIEDARIVSGQLAALYVTRGGLEQQANEWFAEADLMSDLDDPPEDWVETQELIARIAQSIEHDTPPAKDAELVRQYSSRNSQERLNIKDEAIKRLGADTPARLLTRLENEVTAHLIGAQRACSQYLANNVKYIGPLRHAPHLPFGSAPDPDSGSVGIAGEHVAAILQAMRNMERPYPLPNGLNKTVSLEEAVGRWLSFFELADSLSVHEGTPLVYSINLQPPGLENPVLLNSVGVGISQVLPIIVQCLVAGPGALILLEQPELHLHPAAQQRLADFLIACTNWGQFILVESHSEYLVLRLRRRIAEDSSDLLRDKTAIYFAERNQDGDTLFRMVNLTETGGVVEWPEGFFDQGQSEAHQLLIAAAARGSSESREEAEMEISEEELRELKRLYKRRNLPRTDRSFQFLQEPLDDEDLDEEGLERRRAKEQESLRAHYQSQFEPPKRDLNIIDPPIEVCGITLATVSDLKDLADCASDDRTARQIIRQAIQAAPGAQGMRLRLQSLLEWYS